MTALNKGFAVGAAFFSLLFAWQIVGMLLGIDSHDHGNADGAGFDHHDAGDHSDGHDGGEFALTFVTLRSVLAFATLFAWAGTLYLMSGTWAPLALLYSFIWGLVAMVGVSYMIYRLVQLQENGTAKVWTAIGQEGTVYINIPEDGPGKVRVMVSGVMSCVNARSTDGKPLTAGTKVRVTGALDSNTIEVEAVVEPKGGME